MSGKFLLDTNIVIALLAGETNVWKNLTESNKIFIPSIVAGELFYGAFCSPRTIENLGKIQELIDKTGILDWIATCRYLDYRVVIKFPGQRSISRAVDWNATLRVTNMDDIQKYIEKNLEDPEFAQAWEEGECANQVARQLIKLRLDKNMTQREVAARAGTTQSVIARIEHSEQNISLRTLQKLAKALGAEIDIRLQPQR